MFDNVILFFFFNLYDHHGGVNEFILLRILEVTRQQKYLAFSSLRMILGWLYQCVSYIISSKISDT